MDPSVDMLSDFFATIASNRANPSAPHQHQGLNFLNQFPDISPQDLEDNTSCAICLEAFNSGAEPEPALRLPCAHVLGRRCMTRWLESHNSCPMCRHELFDHDQQHERSSLSNGDDDGPGDEDDGELDLEEFQAARRQIAVVEAALDRLERIAARTESSWRRREVAEVERANDRVEARLEELTGRFPELVGGAVGLHAR